MYLVTIRKRTATATTSCHYFVKYWNHIDKVINLVLDPLESDNYLENIKYSRGKVQYARFDSSKGIDIIVEPCPKLTTLIKELENK